MFAADSNQHSAKKMDKTIPHFSKKGLQCYFLQLFWTAVHDISASQQGHESEAQCTYEHKDLVYQKNPFSSLLH